MARDLVKDGAWGEIYDRAPMQALCRQWTRDEYIARMQGNVAAEDAYRARMDAARAAAAEAKTSAANAAREQKKADAARKAREQEALAYVGSYSGNWGLPLDIRADRRWGTKYMRLSDRQIEVLLEGKARDAARIEAAQIASEIAADEAYTIFMAGPQQVSPTRATGRPSGPTKDGMYRRASGEIYKVQKAVHGSGRLYAKRLNVETRSFEYEPGAIFRLTDDDRMTLVQAAEFGRLYGFCVKCGSTLTDEKSIAAGIGPICANSGW